MKLARHDAQVRRFMTAPGVGPITALAFMATIDDPARFARSRSVGAYVGLTRTPCVRRGRLDRSHLQMRRRDATKLPV
jgi:transposase